MVGGLKTAAGRNRTIPIADKILPFIQAMYNPDNKFLVTNKGRQLPYSTLRYHWDLSDVLKSLPNRHLPHDGRHTCASMLANAGVDLKIIQLILGHSSKSITEEVYTHKTLEQLITAINLI
jgi:integrase